MHHMQLFVTHPCITEESTQSSQEVSGNLASLSCLWWARLYAHIQGHLSLSLGQWRGQPGCSLCLPLHAPLRTVCSLYFQLRENTGSCVSSQSIDTTEAGESLTLLYRNDSELTFSCPPTQPSTFALASAILVWPDHLGSIQTERSLTPDLLGIPSKSLR